MKWFNEIWELDVRLVVAIHDEVRFMCPNKSQFRTALALHLTNMYVRSIFSARMGFVDLPAEIAFFSGVDIDTQMRKEPNDQVKTKSLPLGLKETYGIEDGVCLGFENCYKKAMVEFEENG